MFSLACEDNVEFNIIQIEISVHRWGWLRRDKKKVEIKNKIFRKNEKKKQKYYHILCDCSVVLRYKYTHMFTISMQIVHT